jgi:hypothetical protein
MCVICGIKLARNMINASVCTIYIYYAAVWLHDLYCVGYLSCLRWLVSLYDICCWRWLISLFDISVYDIYCVWYLTQLEMRASDHLTQLEMSLKRLYLIWRKASDEPLTWAPYHPPLKHVKSKQPNLKASDEPMQLSLVHPEVTFNISVA